MPSKEAFALLWALHNSCITKQGDCYVSCPASTPAGAHTQLCYPRAAQIIAKRVHFSWIYIKTMCFFGGSIQSVSNICLGALDFLLQLVWGQMKTRNADVCTQMNSWFQASSLHSFHRLRRGCAWTSQNKGVGVLFLLWVDQCLCKEKPQIAPKGTRRGGLFPNPIPACRAALRKKGYIIPRSSGTCSLFCPPAGATSPRRVMLNFTVRLYNLQFSWPFRKTAMRCVEQSKYPVRFNKAPGDKPPLDEGSGADPLTRANLPY